MLKPGDVAPEFEATDHTGKRLHLRDLKGTKVILWFFPKADTSGCTREGMGFRDRYDQYKELNAEVVGVSFDTQEDSRKFAEKYFFQFPLIPDIDRKIGMMYGACDSPKDEYAKRIAYVIGEDGHIWEAHENVDPATYPHTQLEGLSPAAKV